MNTDDLIGRLASDNNSLWQRLVRSQELTTRLQEAVRGEMGTLGPQKVNALLEVLQEQKDEVRGSIEMLLFLRKALVDSQVSGKESPNVS